MAVPLLALQADHDVQGNGRVHLLGTDPDSICCTTFCTCSIGEQPLISAGDRGRRTR